MLRTQHIAWARCGRQAVRGCQAVRGRQAVRIYRYIQARAWQYKFHHLTYLREARFARQLHAFECNSDIISRVNGEVIS